LVKSDLFCLAAEVIKNEFYQLCCWLLPDCYVSYPIGLKYDFIWYCTCDRTEPKLGIGPSGSGFGLKRNQRNGKITRRGGPGVPNEGESISEKIAAVSIRLCTQLNS